MLHPLSAKAPGVLGLGDPGFGHVSDAHLFSFLLFSPGLVGQTVCPQSLAEIYFPDSEVSIKAFLLQLHVKNFLLFAQREFSV